MKQKIIISIFLFLFSSLYAWTQIIGIPIHPDSPIPPFIPDRGLPGKFAPIPFSEEGFSKKYCGQLLGVSKISKPMPISLEKVHLIPPILSFPPEGETSPPQSNEDRLVFWLHGLGGSPESWAKPADASQNNFIKIEGYPARKIRSIQPSYESQQNATLNLAANHLRGIMESATQTFEGNSELGDDYTRENHFIIAHSQGGLVARWLDLIYTTQGISKENRPLGGIVTFGTPHGGAFVATEESKELLQQLAEDLCISTIEPKVLATIDEKLINSLLVNILTSFQEIRDFIGKGCHFAAHEGLPLLLAAQNKDMRKDYIPNAPALEILKTHDENGAGLSNKVAFYGVEEEPVLWNTANALFDKPELKEVFSANGDGTTAFNAEINRRDIFLKTLEWEETYKKRIKNANTVCIGTFIIPLVNVIACNIAVNRANDAQQTYFSFSNALNFYDTANDKYKIAIGAIELETSSTGCLCEHESNGFQFTFPGDCNGQTEIGDFINCKPENLQITVIAEHPSDGVVTVPSATAYPGAKYKIKMEGSNHQQMRNDTNTKNRLNELWEGDFGIYFDTNKKQ
jgi:pimeloyl-ACP methyl ester carboxylesterase